MVDRQTKAERKVAASKEVARRESKAPWITWREVPLLIVLLPFAFIIGMHVEGLAMLVRKYLRIPHFLTFLFLYALLLVPAWIWFDTNFWVLLVGTAIVFLASLCSILLGGRDQAMNGGRFDDSAPAHITLLLFYLLIPAINSAAEARSRAIERRNNRVQVESPTANSDDGDVTPAAE